MYMVHTAGSWTLAELDRLPQDGNKYELVNGELFVTPAPSPAHESLAITLRLLIEPYVHANGLGRVYTPRAVLRAMGSEVEPDLMVRESPEVLPDLWDDMPVPSLVVEVMSATTRRRDAVQKRNFFMRCGVAQYWIVDAVDRSIRVVKPDAEDLITRGELVWQPDGAAHGLTIDVERYFRAAVGGLP